MQAGELPSIGALAAESMSLSIGTFVLGDIIEQLDRLEGVQLLEFSLVLMPELEEEPGNTGLW